MSDHVEILREYNIWRRGTVEDMAMPAPDVTGQAIDAAIDEIVRLRKIEKAARNLIAMKGRHNTAAAYDKLVKALS